MYQWQASIFTHEDRKEKNSDKTYAVYKIVVQDANHSWNVDRRYSEFCDLHAKLKEKLPDYTLPQLPSKSYVNFGSEDVKKNNRRIGLEKYLKLILDNDTPTSKCGELVLFLDPDNKSGLNITPSPPKEQQPLEFLPLIPTNVFPLLPETISLSNGEECFPLLLLDHISESIKYLVDIHRQIGTASSISTKMNLFEAEKEKITATVLSLTQQQSIITQLREYATAKKEGALLAEANYYSTPHPQHGGNNIHSNQPPPPYYSVPDNRYYPAYGAPYPPQNYSPTTYRDRPPQYRERSPEHLRTSGGMPVTIIGGPNIGYHPPVHDYNGPVSYNPNMRDVSSNWEALSRYMETCLSHIQMALIWESGFAEYIMSQEEPSFTWCEIEERVKWFESETDKMVIGSLGITMEKDARLALRKKMKVLREQAARYDEELNASLQHKCTQRDTSHARGFHSKLKALIAFMKDTSERMPGRTLTPDEAVMEFESQMYKTLQDITNIRESMKHMDTKEERRQCKNKATEIRDKIDSLMKEATDLKKSLVKQMKGSDDPSLRKSVSVDGLLRKLTTSSDDVSIRNSANVDNGGANNQATTQPPDVDGKLVMLTNRLEDLQENLADLLHDFAKSSDIIVDRDGILNLKGRKLEDARKEHEDADQDLFSL